MSRVPRGVDVYQRAGQGDLDRKDLEQWLRETGEDVDRPDQQGLTMLMWASSYGQTPTVQVIFLTPSRVEITYVLPGLQLLLNHGASLYAVGRELESPLHLAAR